VNQDIKEEVDVEIESSSLTLFWSLQSVPCRVKTGYLRERARREFAAPRAMVVLGRVLAFDKFWDILVRCSGTQSSGTFG
jgi:hypothetical protein